METRIWKIQPPNTQEKEAGNKLVWGGYLQEFPDFQFGFNIDAKVGRFEYIVSSAKQRITKSEKVEMAGKFIGYKDDLLADGGQTHISLDRQKELKKSASAFRLNSLSIQHPLDEFVWGEASRLFLRYGENTFDHVVFDLGAEGIQLGLQPFLNDRSKYCVNVFKQGEEVVLDKEIQSQDSYRIEGITVSAAFDSGKHTFSIGQTPKRQYKFTFPEPTYGLALLTAGVSSDNPQRWMHAFSEVQRLANSSRS